MRHILKQVRIPDGFCSFPCMKCHAVKDQTPHSSSFAVIPILWTIIGAGGSQSDLTASISGCSTWGTCWGFGFHAMSAPCCLNLLEKGCWKARAAQIWADTAGKKKYPWTNSKPEGFVPFRSHVHLLLGDDSFLWFEEVIWQRENKVSIGGICFYWNPNCNIPQSPSLPFLVKVLKAESQIQISLTGSCRQLHPGCLLSVSGTCPGTVISDSIYTSFAGLWIIIWALEGGKSHYSFLIKYEEICVHSREHFPGYRKIISDLSRNWWFSGAGDFNTFLAKMGSEWEGRVFVQGGEPGNKWDCCCTSG